MIGQHQPRHSVCSLNVWRLSAQSHLNAGWSPWYELSQLPLPDSLQALVHLCGVHLTLENTPINTAYKLTNHRCAYLNDVEDGNEAVLGVAVLGSRHHHVLGLEETSHHVQDCCFSDVHLVGVGGQGRVACHQEMQAGGWNQWGQQSHQIIVHV